MTGNKFARDAVARAVALFEAGLDPQAVRVRIFHEYPELTGFGLDRVLAIAQGRDRRSLLGAPARRRLMRKTGWTVPKVPGQEGP